MPKTTHAQRPAHTKNEKRHKKISHSKTPQQHKTFTTAQKSSTVPYLDNPKIPTTEKKTYTKATNVIKSQKDTKSYKKTQYHIKRHKIT